jgi:integrase
LGDHGRRGEGRERALLVVAEYSIAYERGSSLIGQRARPVLVVMYLGAATLAATVRQWRLTRIAPSSGGAAGGLRVRSLDPDAFIFGSNGRPLSSMEVHRTWRRVLTAAQVRYRSPEQLRHTFASSMLPVSF